MVATTEELRPSGVKSGHVVLELGDLKVATPEEVRKAMGEAQKEMASMPCSCR